MPKYIHAAQIEGAVRMLLESGDINPMGARILEKIVEEGAVEGTPMVAIGKTLTPEQEEQVRLKEEDAVREATKVWPPVVGSGA